jgi:hypothetical protein
LGIHGAQITAPSPLDDAPIAFNAALPGAITNGLRDKFTFAIRPNNSRVNQVHAAEQHNQKC